MWISIEKLQIQKGSRVSLGSWRELGWPKETNPKRLWSGALYKNEKESVGFRFQEKYQNQILIFYFVNK